MDTTNSEVPSITEEQALEKLQIYSVLNQFTGPDYLIAREFEQKARTRINLLEVVRKLQISLDNYHSNMSLNIKDCFTVLNLGTEKLPYIFDDHNEVIVQLSRHVEYHDFSTLIEYDESGRITTINISYYNGHEWVRIVPEYDESLNCICLNFTFERDGNQSTNSIHTNDLDTIIIEIFPPQNPNMTQEVLAHLENPKITALSDPTVYESGIAYDNWDHSREALILFGEGNITRKSELTGLDLEGQVFLDAGLDNIFQVGNADDKTTQIANWVDDHFKENPEGKRSFDYLDFGGVPNNFHKCQVEINYMPDGKYVLRIRQGQNMDMPERQLAQATLQERVVNSVYQKFNFPRTKDYFYIGGLELINQRLIEAGLYISWSSYWALNKEKLEINDFYNVDDDRTIYDYVSRDKPMFNPSFEYGDFIITLSLNLPRSSRVGFQILKNEEGEQDVFPYDSWEVNPGLTGNGKVTGRIARDYYGQENLPTLTVSIMSKSLKSPDINDKTKMLSILESLKQIIESVKITVNPE